MTEFIADRYYWVQTYKEGNWELREGLFWPAHGGGTVDRPPINWIIIPSLAELLSVQIGEKDKLIAGRYYWVQFYSDGSRQVGRWEENFFNTYFFEQDHSHPDPMRWVMIPSPEELLQEQRFGDDRAT